MERTLTCIICPRGCEMSILLSDEGKIEKTEGNACPRGAAYAEDECVHPQRTVTSTARCKSGHIVALKTRTAIPKELVFEAMDVINSLILPDDISVGDVALPDLLGTGVDLVVTGEKTI